MYLLFPSDWAWRIRIINLGLAMLGSERAVGGGGELETKVLVNALLKKYQKLAICSNDKRNVDMMG